jgi:TatD DNase family protein
MRLVDTHAHLDMKEFSGELDGVVERAVSAGVERIISPGVDISSSKAAVEIAHRYPQVFAAIGFHPHEADKVTESDITAMRKLALSSDKVVAIGEVGLDYCKNFSSKENQKWVFQKCLGAARELDLPVIMHSREAHEDLIQILSSSGKNFVKGVVHCFSGPKEALKKVLEMGLYVSFAGNITFEKARDLRDLAVLVPPEKLLLETDSPYLAPEPLRGRRNEPANVKYLTEFYAGIYALSPADIARITTHNANALFRLGLDESPSVAYPIRDAMYLNITNRCTNRCVFCTRETSDFVKGHNLRLGKEPGTDEIIGLLGDISGYKEVVFCGFGEPTLRLDLIKAVGPYARAKGKRVRLVTNGEGDLINGRKIAAELAGAVDIVSVSLNTPNAQEYDRICRSVYGEAVHDAVLSFIKDCSAAGIEVEVTCLDIIGEAEVSGLKAVSESLGARFRLRHLDVVG